MGMGGMLEEVDMMILMKMSRGIGDLILAISFIDTTIYKLRFILYNKITYCACLQSLDVIVELK